MQSSQHLARSLASPPSNVIFLTQPRDKGRIDTPVLAGDEVSRLEEDGSSVVPREGLPLLLGGKSRLDGAVDHLGGSGLVGAEVLGVVVGHRLRHDVAGLDL
jgi:hypothetical protein